MNSFLRQAALMLAAGALVAACSGTSHAPGQSELNGTAWVLASLPGQSLLPDVTATARFEDSRVQGTDGCNRYSMSYTADGSKLRVDPRGPATQMACPPPVMEQAEAFTHALARAASYRVVGGQLQILANGGAVLATLDPQSQSLAGTSWRVTGYNNGKEAVVSVIAGTELTMAFSDDNKAAGSAGCNRYHTAYTLQGQKLTFGPVAATRKMCGAPERIMEQEQEFLKALETVAAMRAEGQKLEMRTAAGALAVTLTRGGGQ